MAPNLPEVNEIVVGRITRVLDYGVFIDLVEYEGITGFVHISQVATGWVKNIRGFVKEGQIRACQVMHIDHEKGQLELSLSKVSAGAQRAKIESYNYLKRSQKMLEVYAKEINSTFDEVWAGVAVPLLENYDTLQEAFERISIDGESAMKGVNPKFADSFLKMLQKNLEVPEKTVRGVFTLESRKPNGVEVIKSVLIAGRKSVTRAKVDLYSIGSGKYDVKVSTPDFKESEKILRSVSEAVLLGIKKEGGTGKFEKVES